jgi:hypothetical protein
MASKHPSFKRPRLTKKILTKKEEKENQFHASNFRSRVRSRAHLRARGKNARGTALGHGLDF